MASEYAWISAACQVPFSQPVACQLHFCWASYYFLDAAGTSVMAAPALRNRIVSEVSAFQRHLLSPIRRNQKNCPQNDRFQPKLSEWCHPAADVTPGFLAICMQPDLPELVSKFCWWPDVFSKRGVIHSSLLCLHSISAVAKERLRS